jgi:hypothetical protein
LGFIKWLAMGTPKLTKGARRYLAEIGRKGGLIGGRAKSEAKIEASRVNGRLGGRPRDESRAETHPGEGSAAQTKGASQAASV